MYNGYDAVHWQVTPYSSITALANFYFMSRLRRVMSPRKVTIMMRLSSLRLSGYINWCQTLFIQFDNTHGLVVACRMLTLFYRSSTKGSDRPMKCRPSGIELFCVWSAVIVILWDSSLPCAYTGCGKRKYHLKLFAIFWAAAFNFNATFCQPIPVHSCINGQATFCYSLTADVASTLLPHYLVHLMSSCTAVDSY